MVSLLLALLGITFQFQPLLILLQLQLIHISASSPAPAAAASLALLLQLVASSNCRQGFFCRPNFLLQFAIYYRAYSSLLLFLLLPSCLACCPMGDAFASWPCEWSTSRHKVTGIAALCWFCCCCCFCCPKMTLGRGIGRGIPDTGTTCLQIWLQRVAGLPPSLKTLWNSRYTYIFLLYFIQVSLGLFKVNKRVYS